MAAVDTTVQAIFAILLKFANVLLAFLGTGALQNLLNWVISFINQNPVTGDNAFIVALLFMVGLVNLIPSLVDAYTGGTKGTGVGGKSWGETMHLWN